MSLNCRVGDLAIIVNCEFPENIGAIVEVVAPGAPSLLAIPGLPYWHVVSKGRLLKVRSWRYGVRHCHDPYVYDYQLRPLRDEPEPEPERVEKPEEITA